MALGTAALKSGLEALYASGRVGDGINDSQFADGMANLLTTFVQSGAVTTLVTGVTPGVGTAPGTGTIA